MSDPAQENQRGCCPDPGLVERLRPASEVSASPQIRGLGPILCQTKLGQERVSAEARDDRSNPEAVEDVYSQAGSPKHFFFLCHLTPIPELHTPLSQAFLDI